MKMDGDCLPVIVQYRRIVNMGKFCYVMARVVSFFVEFHCFKFLLTWFTIADLLVNIFF